MCSPKQEDKSKGNTRKRKTNHKLKEMAKKILKQHRKKRNIINWMYQL